MEHSVTEQHPSVHATKSPGYDPKQIPMEPANSRYEMTRADDYEQIPMEPANSRYEMIRADDDERIPMEPANSRYEMTEIQESATVPALSPSPQ
jgi:SOS-response transcriptional repressor LexA